MDKNEWSLSRLKRRLLLNGNSRILWNMQINIKRRKNDNDNEDQKEKKTKEENNLISSP